MTGQWRVDNDQHYLFTSALAAERFARQIIVEQEHLTGATSPIEITCDGLLVARVVMDGMGCVWTDVVASEIV